MKEGKNSGEDVKFQKSENKNKNKKKKKKKKRENIEALYERLKRREIFVHNSSVTMNRSLNFANQGLFW